MIDPTGSVSALGALQPAIEKPAAPGFGEFLTGALEGVSASENKADEMVARLAAGDDIQLHEVAIATTEAALAVELLVAVRDQAVQAYQQIANLQL